MITITSVIHLDWPIDRSFGWLCYPLYTVFALTILVPKPSPLAMCVIWSLHKEITWGGGLLLLLYIWGAVLTYSTIPLKNSSTSSFDLIYSYIALFVTMTLLKIHQRNYFLGLEKLSRVGMKRDLHIHLDLPPRFIQSVLYCTMAFHEAGE